MGALRDSLSDGFGRLSTVHSSWVAVLLCLFPATVVLETVPGYDGQPLVPVVVLSVAGAALLVQSRPRAHDHLGTFGITVLATFLGLGWAAWFVTGEWVTAWATVPEAMLLYLVAGLLSYGLVYVVGIDRLKRTSGR
ncbi:hypothetical protein GJ629_12525 [Halapricum sp. CBA1109]|uniref:hypothetical protein n=1 Tax=Halapricum sp. CBA1109 TaxID=2668068 RepID=UPI0013BBF482|nr:hypothetical protein [Halapricum sp. CBA1109]MUV90621.1 hypothetical protein [Halapricum sp. CBA1109]